VPPFLDYQDVREPYFIWYNEHYIAAYLTAWYTLKWFFLPWLRAPQSVPCPRPGKAFIPIADPLEQFDVLPLLDFAHFTNLSFVLLLNLILMGLLLCAFNPSGRTAYDFMLRNIYQLVRSIARENIYIRKQQYFAILFYLFGTLLLANLAGLIPYSFTVTSSFVVTFFLALSHFVGINLIGWRELQWRFPTLFLPSGAPTAIAPFLTFIEIVSYIARVFSLSIRLFANMMSGHALLKILIGFSWTMLSSPLMAVVALLPWVVVTAISYLELLIAFLQAYVFVILIALYINDVLNPHD
jgi:ATP synthase subunit 6